MGPQWGQERENPLQLKGYFRFWICALAVRFLQARSPVLDCLRADLRSNQCSPAKRAHQRRTPRGVHCCWLARLRDRT
jgi:hypothetical protein